MKEKLEEIRSKILKEFNRLEKRQRTLVLLLIAAILFSIYYNMVFKPQSHALRTVTLELEGVNNQIALLKNQIPDVERQKENLRISKERLDSQLKSLKEMESKLPALHSVPQILGDLVSQAAGYYVDFISIKPKTNKDAKEYTELNIEMVFDSTYADLVNYLHRLEFLFQFLETKNIHMEEMKNGLNGRTKVTLVLTTLLGETGETLEEVKTEEAVSPIEIKRNPFATVLKPDKKEKDADYRLSGIVATGRQPTAIINDEVYHVGDKIGNGTVKQILPTMVIISSGSQNIIVTIEE